MIKRVSRFRFKVQEEAITAQIVTERVISSENARGT